MNATAYFAQKKAERIARLQREYCERAQMRMRDIIQRVERDTAYYDAIYEECVTSISIAFPQQLYKLLDTLDKYQYGGTVSDFRHQAYGESETLLPALRALAAEFTPENLTNVGESYPELTGRN